MLFFFELFLFVLVMLTLALGEFVDRAAALGLWIVVTAIALGGYLLARQSLRSLADAQDVSAESADEAAPAHTLPTAAPDEAPSSPPAGADAPTPLDEKWARTLLYNWRRTNVLLLVGVAVVGVWYWLGRA
jgi:hypothetical protein